jgi:glyoxylase-like metal-dependent hydrolase (beta-lactamase superfamily II)
MSMTDQAPPPDVTGFYHEPSGSIAYIVADPATRHAVIIDPVLDFDEKAGRISTSSADELLRAVESRDLTIDWILDTHPHADHLSAAAYLKEQLRAPMAIGAKVIEVQKLWQSIYNEPDFPIDGKSWDHLFADGETFSVGSLSGSVMLSPGHTLASVTYVIGDTAFVHDTLFQPDFGTARADFPGGSAQTLYESIQRILALPEQTRLFTGHDYKPNGRDAQWESTVLEQKRSNVHLTRYPTRDTYIAMREARDRTLPMPALILPALQINLRGGRLPPPENNGRSYLKIPIGAL